MRALLPIALTSATFAAPVQLTLDQSNGENIITIKATVTNTFIDTKTTTYSGTIEANITLDGDDVTSFEMTGGRITATNTTFLFESLPFFSQTATFDQLAATPVSPNGAETLATPGQFSAVEHYFLFNEGCIVLAGTFGDSKSDVQSDPFKAAGDNIGTINSDTPAEVRSSLTDEVIATSRLIHLALPLESTVINEDETFTTETTGTVTASGILLEYSHPFFEWAAANGPAAGTALSFNADADHDGQEDGISWALGFPPGVASKQLTLSRNPSTGELTFTLPGPTRSPLTLQKSTSLSSDDWSVVPGFEALPTATTGTITLPNSSDAFYRFIATPD